MTIDDVVVTVTVGLLAVTGIPARSPGSWCRTTLRAAAWIGAALVGLVLGLVISSRGSPTRR